MYKVIKERGNNVNVFVENTEAHKSLNIGRLSMDMVRILEEAGCSFGTASDELSFKDTWSIEINSDTKDKLAKLAMRMSKPIRHQASKAKTEASEQPALAPDEIPDLFELIFG